MPWRAALEMIRSPQEPDPPVISLPRSSRWPAARGSHPGSREGRLTGRPWNLGVTEKILTNATCVRLATVVQVNGELGPEGEQAERTSRDNSGNCRV